MDDVVLCECFARDGLQHEAEFIPTARKIAAIDSFAALGFGRVEATSYSHPKYVPQFADADEVLRGITRPPGIRFKATCPNLNAVRRAIAAQEAGYGPEEISLLVSASDSHSRRNLNRGREEQWQLVESMAAEGAGRFVMVGTISVALGCPFEGTVPMVRVVDDARRMAAAGVTHIAIGDTVGMGTPRSMRALFTTLRAELPDCIWIAHFHDTRGTGIANCMAAYEAGVRHFDCAFGGVGGHPTEIRYGEGYTGNVCTEDLATMFEGMGIRTGLDMTQLLTVAQSCEALLGRPLRGMVTRSGLGLLKETVHA